MVSTRSVTGVVYPLRGKTGWKFPQGCARAIYKTVPWKIVNYRASLELVGFKKAEEMLLLYDYQRRITK